MDGSDKILQGEQRKGFERRLHIERQQRGPENNQKRQHKEHEGIEQQQRGSDVTPTAELDDRGPVTLAGDSVKFVPLPRDAKIDV